MHNTNKSQLTYALISIAGVLYFLCAGLLIAQDNNDAYSAFQNRDFDAAIRIANIEILQDPTNIDAHVVLGWGYLATGRHQEALITALQGQKLAPQDARIVAVIGESYYYLQNYLEALSFLEQYVSLLPDGIAIGRVHWLMGEIFIQFGEYNHADIAITAALNFDPTVENWWIRLGFAREQGGHYTYAVRAYQRALALNPNSVEIQRSLTRAQELANN